MKLRVFLPSCLAACACTFAVIAYLPNPALESVSGVTTRPALSPTFFVESGASEERPLTEQPITERSSTEVRSAAIPVSEEIKAKLEALREALSAAAQIENPNLRNETLAATCYRWAELDPRQALEIALDCGLQNTPGAVIENLTQQWAVVDFSAARDWIDSQPPSDLRSDLVGRLGYLWAGRDPEAAAVFVLDRTKPGPIQEEAIISILHQWTQRDRAAALAWVGKFPPGELRERALWEAQEHSAALRN